MQRATLFTLFLLLFPLTSYSADDVDLRDIMSFRDYEAAGLRKLTDEEIKHLNGWIKEYTKGARSTQKESSVAAEPAKEEKKYLFGSPKDGLYKIDRVNRDTTFVINNRSFEAMKKCPGFKAGDRVRFTEGSPYGLCTTAKFVGKDGEPVCKVWCEED